MSKFDFYLEVLSTILLITNFKIIILRVTRPLVVGSKDSSNVCCYETTCFHHTYRYLS